MMSAPPVIKFRNYKPSDALLKAGGLPTSADLKAAAEAQAKSAEHEDQREGHGSAAASGQAAPVAAPQSAPTVNIALVPKHPAPSVILAKQLAEEKAAAVSGGTAVNVRGSRAEDKVEELPAEVTIAPRKPNWDLKRDIEGKLAILERQTQRAIAELVRERIRAERGEVGADGKLDVDTNAFVHAVMNAGEAAAPRRDAGEIDIDDI
jgi:hypothetical protein